MNARRIMAAMLIGGALAAIGWQRSQVTGVRNQNETLRAARQEAARLEMENAELSKLRAAVASQSRSDGASTELLQLRNEVRQLRAQQRELERLRAENGRLATEVGSGTVAPRKLSEMDGFMAKESWNNAGFDSPEATVETFFWATREGDLARMAECMTSEERQYLLRLTEQGNEQERAGTLSEFQGLTQGSGLRILSRTDEPKLPPGAQTIVDGIIVEGNSAPAKVTLRLQAAAGGAVIPIQLSRERDGWKVKGF